MSKDAKELADLTAEEIARYDVLDATIADGMKTFEDVGSSLCEIRDSRLYRNQFGTFAQYCRERFSRSQDWAYRLIAATKVIEECRPGQQTQPKLTPRAVRPLTSGKLSDDEKSQAMSLAADEAAAESREVTSTDTQRAVKAVKKLAGSEPPPNVVQAILDGEKLAEQRAIIQKVRATLKELAAEPVGTFLTRGSLDVDLRNAREAIKFARPECGCVYCGAKGCEACSQTGWLSYGKFQQAVKFNPELVEDARKAGLIK